MAQRKELLSGLIGHGRDKGSARGGPLGSGRAPHRSRLKASDPRFLRLRSQRACPLRSLERCQKRRSLSLNSCTSKATPLPRSAAQILCHPNKPDPPCVSSHSKRLNSDHETILPRPASILVAPYFFLEGSLDRIDISLRLFVVHCYRTRFASTLFRGTNAPRPQKYQGVPQVIRSHNCAGSHSTAWPGSSVSRHGR